MNEKEVTKTFRMISNRKNSLVYMVYTKIIQRCRPTRVEATEIYKK